MASLFRRSWWSFELPGCRPCQGTYENYSYEALPPLDERLHQGRFQWLTGDEAGADARREKPSPTLSALQAAASKARLELPAAFVTFMSQRRLQDCVESCTACEWELGEALVPCRVQPGAYTIRFLRDQQDCLFWYLYLMPDGQSEVLCSPISLDDAGPGVSREAILANTCSCAPDFESFVHRFWLENGLWAALGARDPVLSEEQAAYAAHYKDAPRAQGAAVDGRIELR